MRPKLPAGFTERDVARVTRVLMRDIGLFTEGAGGIRLRAYQEQVARAIIDSVLQKRGLSLVVMFPRQSGKNEIQAQVEAYLLRLYSEVREGEIIKVSPTWNPQSINAMDRLEAVLRQNFLVRPSWVKEHGNTFRVGQMRIKFLSGSPASNVVGATASTLLECDEAQDILPAKWDKEFAPMAASTNATRVFWGTAWTSQTLLARELRAALEAERQDGIRRVFRVSGTEVAEEVEDYRTFLEEAIARHGRQHPLVKTQLFSEEIDAEMGMFPERRLALMQGDHPRQRRPTPGRLYAFLLDVGGEDEGVEGEDGDAPGASAAVRLRNPSRDATAFTIVEVDLSGLNDPLVQAPVYRVVERRLWLGARHSDLHNQIRALEESWEPRYLVVDATGVGAGLASFLERCYPERTIPFHFNSATKSKLGWDFLAIVENGRFRDWRAEPGTDDEQRVFWEQCRLCRLEIGVGEDRRLRWGVPEGMRSPVTGELVHDDLVLSAALAAVLDAQPWGLGESAVVRASDPLGDMSEVY